METKYSEFLKLNFYQIYIRSFMDANNDGIGDIRGIISKADYLSDLGINAVWITPFYESPDVDCGYDISDYEKIQKEYGDLSDFKSMVKEFHKRDIKVIVDLVVNHTSSEHKWFKSAKSSANSPYHNYYYWAKKPLNDWQSRFGGSAWEYVDNLKEYYLHSFAVEQPDLNWTNPKVIEEVKKIIDFWTDIGVDGFRCDVLDRISKDFENDLQANGPNLHEYIFKIFGRGKTKNLYTVGECWSANEKNLIEMTGEERRELCSSFIAASFNNPTLRFTGKEIGFKDIREYLSKYQKLTQKNNLIFSPFFENHDLGRVISRFGVDKEYRYAGSTFFATLLYTCRGNPFILQGQEFGTPNAYYDDINDFNDISTVNYYEAHKNDMPAEKLWRTINLESRDNARRPMMWSNGINGGFNDGAKTWLKINERYKEYSLETDLSNEQCVFGYYKKIIRLRKDSPALIYGEFDDVTGDREDCFIFTRSYGKEKLLVVCCYDKKASVKIPLGAEKIIGNYDNDSSEFNPFECAVYRLS